MNFDGQPKKKTNWLLWIGLLGIFLVGIPVACCGGLAVWGFGMASAPLDAAEQALEADPRVTEKLGTPIKRDEFKITDFESTNGSGSAGLDTNFSGPNGSARVEGTMRQDGGSWSVEQLTVTFDDGTSVELP